MEISNITLLQWLGILVFFVGRSIRRAVRRRRFERVNKFGVSGFSSFNAYEYTGFFEGIVYLIGSVLRLSGIFFFSLVWVANRL